MWKISLRSDLNWIPLSIQECGEKTGDLVRFAVEVRETSPYTLAFHLSFRGRAIYVTDSCCYKAVVFSSDAGDWSPYNVQWGGEDGYKMGRAMGTHKLIVLTASDFDGVCPQVKLGPLITELNAHLAQELEKVKEDSGEGEAVAHPAATPHPQSKSTGKWHHVWATKWRLLDFHPPTLTLEPLVSQPIRKPTGKEMLQNIVHLTQVDSLQSPRTVYKGDLVRMNKQHLKGGGRSV